MDKICVNLYGGKSIFGGRETPLEADEIFCDNAKSCTLYKEGKCLCCRAAFARKCPNGRVITTKGYTSRARKYGEFRSKYTNDKVYSKLKYPQENYFAILGDKYWFRLTYVAARKADERDDRRRVNEWGYIVDNTATIGNNQLIIPCDEINIDLLNTILSYIPRTFFGNDIITDYQDKAVPRILNEMKEKAPDLYTQLAEKYPKYKNEEYAPNYVGMWAYTKTLKNGAVIKDCHGNEGVVKDGKIYCDTYTSGFVPFGGKSATVVVEIKDTDVFKITDNSQVDENTKFK